MNSDGNPLLKRERIEYVIRNKALLDILYDCYRFHTLGYEEIVKTLEEKRENAAGLLIKLERGIQLGLIVYDGLSSLRDRTYYFSEEGNHLYEIRESLVNRETTVKVRENTRAEKKAKYIV